MPLKFKILKSFVITVGIITLSGCATTNFGTPLDHDAIKIEKHQSRIATIGQVKVYKQKDGILIRGKIRRNSYSRGHISGHIDIQLIDAKGNALHSDSTGYTHSGIRFSSEKFSVKLKQKIEKGYLLRITHRGSSHRDNEIN